MSDLGVPTLETDRLTVRPFVLADLDVIHPILNAAFGDDMTRDDRRVWLEWTVLNYGALDQLFQPPYGDRGVVLRATGELVGAVGLVALIGPFETLPSFRARLNAEPGGLLTFELGLYWAISPAHQRQGYASEAAQALVDYAFRHLYAQRILATTNYTNAASIGVMRRLGMTIEHNPHPDPVWFQVVGVLFNPAADGPRPFAHLVD